MGLLKLGRPLPWADSKVHLNYVRQHGVLQFIETWLRVKNIQNDILKYGDEIEVGIFVIDETNKTVKISLRSAELQELLREREVGSGAEIGCSWQPEFGSWMIESTPSVPFGNYTSDLLKIERNMIMRRRRLVNALRPNEIAPTMTCFPLFGRGNFVDNESPFSAPYSDSVFVPDIVINPHPRFATLTNNIRSRRGRKVDMRIPLFRDKNTPEFDTTLRATYVPPEEGINLEPDTDIHMDCMAFGMGESVSTFHVM